MLTNTSANSENACAFQRSELRTQALPSYYQPFLSQLSHPGTSKGAVNKDVRKDVAQSLIGRCIAEKQKHKA